VFFCCFCCFCCFWFSCLSDTHHACLFRRRQRQRQRQFISNAMRVTYRTINTRTLFSVRMNAPRSSSLSDERDAMPCDATRHPCLISIETTTTTTTDRKRAHASPALGHGRARTIPVVDFKLFWKSRRLCPNVRHFQ